ncbi:CoB--CoM heterodisulfide reductase iron-sulfur subunit B family protein [uncultured Thiodictyon sp.]|uniref:CoB--CoM heterodisulfide reductase iron-sulfur subunit B family protein n=1 Tax=uncultured Thiodictyon sp. TaxID=1846217 RepID=UPI0025D38C28|nr:CoB--CoM heterodisulfide reductase iron-sulfur subunit B family protein [uncultured Thiodictyon sp.]
MRISYFPGCTLKNHAVNFDDSTIAACTRLGLEVKELDRWNCCGTVHGLAADDLIHRMAPITNLIRAKEAGADAFMTGCAMCYSTLKRANLHLRQNPEALSVVNGFLSLEQTDYRGDLDVLHLLELLRDRIGFEQLAARVERPLSGLRVACYYGCLLVRPREAAIDDSEQPRVMEDLMAALGATPVAFPLKTECCGAYQVVADPGIIAERTRRIMGSAASHGADLVVMSCPLCAYNLDDRQADARRLDPDLAPLPVFYFTQLMALALGCGEEVLRLERHRTDPRAPLTARGLL